jgi:hypothetical protein|nr:MAG TPA: hypothetical protein [Bacteriophage sp.]
MISIICKDENSGIYDVNELGIPTPLVNIVTKFSDIENLPHSVPVIFSRSDVSPTEEYWKIKNFVRDNGILAFTVDSMKEYVKNLYEHIKEVKSNEIRNRDNSSEEYFCKGLSERFKKIQYRNELEFDCNYYLKYNILVLSPKNDNSKVIKYALIHYLRGTNSFGQIEIK